MGEPHVFPSADAELTALIGHYAETFPAYRDAEKRAQRIDALLASDADGCSARINGTRVALLLAAGGRSSRWAAEFLAAFSLITRNSAG